MPRNILFFTESSLYGGDDTVLIELLKSWPSSEDRLTAALNSGHPGLAIYAGSLGGRAGVVAVNEAPRSSGPLARLLGFAGSIKVLSRFLDKNRPDVLMVSSGGYPLAPMTWRLLCAARLKRLPRVILTVHNYPGRKAGAARRLYSWLVGGLAFLLCDRVVSVSRDCAQALDGYGLRASPKVLPIYNGLSPRAERAGPMGKRLALKVPEGRLIGAVGNLEERKGFKYLILAMKKIAAELPAASLVIIGAVSEKKTADGLRRLVEESGLSGKVFLTGFLPDAGQYAECFEVCVIPSVARESFGLLAVEAMRYKKPVVATRVGGLPEVVADGETGLVVEPGDPEGLAEAILSLLKSPAKAAEMGEAGHRRWLERFTAERMARDYHSLT